MKPFEESDRLNYDLSPDSVVMDIGVHEGWFTGELNNKFHCQIIGFEPVTRFYKKAVLKFKDCPNIKIYEVALGAENRDIAMGVKGDLTGAFCKEPNNLEMVGMWDIAGFMAGQEKDVSLACINCEGGEYDLLERMLDTGIITRFDNISVQMHTVVPDYEERMEMIFSWLDETHDHVYGAPFIWDGFTLRK